MLRYGRTTFFRQTDSAAAYISHGHNCRRTTFDAEARPVYAWRICGGKNPAVGPVLAKIGAFGVAVFEAQDEAEVRQFRENDPSVRAGVNSFEASSMRVAEARGGGAEDK